MTDIPTIERDSDGVAHVVALSGGKDSTAMALRLNETEPRPYTYVCTPTGNEFDAMFAHWRHIGNMLGKQIIPLMRESFSRCCDRNAALPNFRMRFCTRQLKIEPFKSMLLGLMPVVSYVGLRADEEYRKGMSHGGDVPLAVDGGITQDYPLQRWGWGIVEVLEYIASRQIEIPRRTDCKLCFYQTLAEWYLLWREHPEDYAEGEAMESRFGHTLRSPKRDTWPAGLADLRREFEAGRVPEISLRRLERKAMCRVCSL